MGKLFGTDGIRGKANIHPMTAEIALKTGRAVAKVFVKNNTGKVIIGKDTRISGSVFEHALISGLCSMGVDVYLAGVIPTPGIAYLASSMEDITAGIVISASHNPYYDNGIKIFKGDGFKLDDETESQIENLILNDNQESLSETVIETGDVIPLTDASSSYMNFLKQMIEDKVGSFSGINAVIDCSNGASSKVAPRLFRELGVEVTSLFTSPDGKNINDNCGSEHNEAMIESVVETGADIGLAFDGDADRLIAVDAEGTVITGDQIIAICAAYAKDNGTLKNNTVVTTVMSNMGLGAALSDLGVNHIMSSVGDRNVMMDMVKSGSVIGGEDSGHMIFLDTHTTGDGMLSALKLLEVMKKTGKPLSDLAKIMTIYPQKLVNVDVSSKPDLNSVPEIADAIKSSESELKGKGRVLVRYSGTQSMCRVMVEAETDADTELHCKRIAEAVTNAIG